VCGKLTWLGERFVCGFRFLNELHRYVLKKFCVGWYSECPFYIELCYFTPSTHTAFLQHKILPGISEVYTKSFGNKIQPNLLILTTRSIWIWTNLLSYPSQSLCPVRLFWVYSRSREFSLLSQCCSCILLANVPVYRHLKLIPHNTENNRRKIVLFTDSQNILYFLLFVLIW